MKLRSATRIEQHRELAAKELRARLKYLLAYVEKATSVTDVQVYSPRRSKKLVNVRWILCRILRDYGYSFPEIGRAMNRHHSAILMLLKNHNCPAGWEKFYKQLSKVNDEWTPFS